MSYTELKTPQATFRLLHQGEGRKTFARDLPKKFDAAMVELVHQKPVEKVEERFKTYVAELETNPTFKNLLLRVKKNQAQVAFGDLVESPSLESQGNYNLMGIEFMLSLVSLFGGLRILLSKRRLKKESKIPSFTPSMKKKGLLFRSFFLLLFGLWLFSSAIEFLGVILTQTAGNTSKRGFLRSVREAIAQASLLHPGKKVIFFRNLVFAEKAYELVQNLDNKSDQKVIILDFHFGHAGILKVIKWPFQIRRTVLSWYRPWIKDILADPVKKDYLSRLMMVYFDGQRWQLRKSFLVKSLSKL